MVVPRVQRSMPPLLMAIASARLQDDTITVEAEELVEVGSIDPDCVHTPGIFVQRIVRSTINEKRIEFRTVRKREQVERP